jgi:hypothetical protein
MELTIKNGVACLDGQGSLVLQPISKSIYGIKVNEGCEVIDVHACIDDEKNLVALTVRKFRKKSLSRWIILKLLKL